MNIKNIKADQKDHGFTIVELLVVIVVIGILAAITIISYTGITARANTSSAQSAASSVSKKSEIYYVDGPTGAYPVNFSALSAAASSTTYHLSGVTFVGTALDGTQTPQSVNFYRCGYGAADTISTVAAITTVTGAKVGYYKFEPTAGVQLLSIGNVSTAVGTKNIYCGITTTTTQALGA